MSQLATRVGVRTNVRRHHCDRCGVILQWRRRTVSGLTFCTDCKDYRQDYMRKGTTR
jgi:hypothetical protein